jgi:predicted ATPase
MAHHIPTQPTPFIGRQDDIQKIIYHVDISKHRLVTLVGMGGIGKTRLSIEVGEHFAQQSDSDTNVSFVPLAPISDPVHITGAIAESIGFNLSTTDTPESQLVDYLKDQNLMLILDNFEHVLDGKTFVGNLIKHCPQLYVLITSRERLNLEYETLYPVNGLPLPNHIDQEDAHKHDVINLFQQIAEKVDWNFKLTDKNLPQVLTICQLVEGVPLAIELAASWLRVMSLDEIISHLEKNFDVLADSLTHLPKRHRSIRAVFESSWQQLTDTEKTIYTQLSIFSGGFTQDTVRAMFGASPHHILSFIDKSLIYRNTDGRYTLHELLRQYAEEKLNDYPDKLDTIHERHAEYYAHFLTARKSFFSVSGKNRTQTRNEITEELDNIRQVWFYAIESVNLDILQEIVGMVQVRLTNKHP